MGNYRKIKAIENDALKLFNRTMKLKETKKNGRQKNNELRA